MNLTHHRYISLIETVAHNLRSQDVKVDTQQVASALAPAISNGKTHDELSVKLKNQPKTATEIVRKSDVESIDKVSKGIRELSKKLNAHANYLELSKKLTNQFFDRESGEIRGTDIDYDSLPKLLTKSFEDGSLELEIVGFADPAQMTDAHTGYCQTRLALTFDKFCIQGECSVYFHKKGIEPAELFEDSIDYSNRKRTVDMMEFFTEEEHEQVKMLVANMTSFLAISLSASQDLKPFNSEVVSSEVMATMFNNL